MTEGLWDDLKKLKHSKALSTSIEDEKHRRQVDAAKRRAAAQNVDYPTFAAMVSAAHLQPVDRKSLSENQLSSRKSAPAWLFDSSGSLTKSQVRSEAGPGVSKQVVLDPLEKLASFSRDTGNGDVPPAAAKSVGPLTQDGFHKSWKRLSTELPGKRLEFLATVGPFAGIFKVEVPPGTLTEILRALHDALDEKESNVDYAAVIGILHSISKCSRFSITVKLMGQKTGTLVDELFGMLSRHSQDSGICDLWSKFSGK